MSGEVAAGARGGGAVPRGGDAVPAAAARRARACARAHGGALPRTQAGGPPARVTTPQDHRGAQGVYREAQHRARGGRAQVYSTFFFFTMRLCLRAVERLNADSVL